MSEADISLLDLPTAVLMSAGGDDRITLDEQSGLNSYGCAPEPIRAISYSSSTASSISAAAYAHAHSVHHQLRLAVAEGESEDAAYTRFLRNARAVLVRFTGLPPMSTSHLAHLGPIWNIWRSRLLCKASSKYAKSWSKLMKSAAAVCSHKPGNILRPGRHWA